MATQALSLAAKQLGMSETTQRQALQEYMSNGGVNLDPAVTAWCAAYVNATLQQAGYEGTGSNMARSFLEWGEAVEQPQRGDLAVFSRGDPSGPYGHVGFFDGYNPDGSLRILGGNQGDAVSVSTYGADRLLGFRRPEGGWNGQNALAGMMGQGGPQPNALAAAAPRQPELNWTPNLLDPNAFQLRGRTAPIIPI